MTWKHPLVGIAAAAVGLVLAAAPVLADQIVTYTITGDPGTTYGSLTLDMPSDQGFGPGFPGAPACPTSGLTEVFTISGLTSNEHLSGQILIEYVVPASPANPSGRITAGPQIPVNQTGGGTLSINIPIPSSTLWQSPEVHVTAQLQVQDAITGAWLKSGPTLIGAGLDLFENGCPQTPPPGPPLGHGMTATIGFWHNRNGQALINSLNGGPNSTALGTWLASNFPNLFGPSCANLGGKTNTQVAAAFLADFSLSGPAKQDTAQFFAVALASYSTSTTLAGGNTAATYGFATSTNGSGNATFNVGSNGAAFGVPNNTTLTLLQLLQDANKLATNCMTSSAAASVFDAINQGGDIT